MKKRFVHIMASSNLGTRLQLTLSAETADLRDLIVDAVTKITQYSSSSGENFRIDHIDSVSHLHDMNE